MPTSDDLETALRKQIAERVRVVSRERKHTLDDIARETGFGKNVVFRALRHDDPDYGLPPRVSTWAGLLAYCDASWGDLERAHPVNLGEIDSLLRSLPGLDEGGGRVLSAVLMSAYQALREGRERGAA